MKENLELFKKLLEDFTNDPEKRFFCNANDTFARLWKTDSFQAPMRTFAQDFVNEHYPEMKVGQENITFDYPLFISCPPYKTSGEMRIEFLNWLIPQL